MGVNTGSQKSYLRRWWPKRILQGVLGLTAAVLLVFWALAHFGLAQDSVKGKASMEKVFPHSSKCKRCHFRAFEEWESSPLSRSIHSAAFRVALEEYLKYSGNKDRDLCLRCHAPHINEFKERTDYFLEQVRTRDPEIDGVGCAQCHLIKEVDLSQNPPLPMYEIGKTLFGPYSDYVNNLAHGSKEVEIYRKSALCLNCHKTVPTAADLGESNDLLGAWETSPAVKAGKECQTCHMPEQIGESANGEPKRRVANHTFPGRLGRLRQEAAELDIKTVVKGEQSHVTVTVKSLVPHNLPATHPAWASAVLTLKIRGKNLRVVYTEDRVYGRVYADAKGNETLFDFKATKVLKDTVLRPEESRVEKFKFPTPKDAPSMDVIALLKYVPVSGSREFLDRVEGESPIGADDPAFKPIPIIEKSVNIPLRKR